MARGRASKSASTTTEITPLRRSTRTATKRNYEEVDEEVEQEESPEPIPSIKTSKRSTKSGASTRNSKRRRKEKTSKKKKVGYYLDKLLTQPNSILIQVDLKTRFLTMERFKSFTAEQQERLLALLPECEKVPLENDGHTTAKMEINDAKGTSSSSRELFRENGEGTSRNVSLNGNHSTNKDQEKIPTPQSLHNNDERTEVSEKSEPRQKIRKTLRKIFFHNIHYREAVDEFQDKLYAGHFDPKWIKRNEKEQKKLRETVNAEWKDVVFERRWGHNIVTKQLVAGESASISLQELCIAGVIRKDDELHYRRLFGKAKKVVDLTLKIVNVNSEGSIDVLFKRGKKEKIFKDVQKPTTLETLVLDEDGQVPKRSRPHGNANKNFTIIRKGNEQGTIFALRKDYYDKTH